MQAKVYRDVLSEYIKRYKSLNKLESVLSKETKEHPSKLGEFSEKVNKKNTHEPAYQRALLSAGSANLQNIGEVAWLDIELPVVFGESPRRRSLDLLGITPDDKLVLCELKYEKECHEKPSTGSPLYAFFEILIYYYHAWMCADKLQEYEIWHKNKKKQFNWDWRSCKTPDKVVLIVAGNEYYWKSWEQGQLLGWPKVIAEVKARLPDLPPVKFFCTQNPCPPFMEQAKQCDKHRYQPKLGETMSKWVEIQL